MPVAAGRSSAQCCRAVRLIWNWSKSICRLRSGHSISRPTTSRHDCQATELAAPSSAAAILVWLRKRAGVLIVFIVLFLLWEYAVKIFGVKEYLLPPPSKVWAEFLKRRNIVFQGAWVTMQEIVGGYLLAIVVSIPLSLAVARSRFVEESVYPVIVFLQIIPKIAIAPLFIIWLGFGFTPKLLIVFLLCFFPIVVASVAGFKSLDPR